MSARAGLRRYPLTDEAHVWMPPRAGGLERRLAYQQQEHTYKVPGGGSVTFACYMGDLPPHQFTARWCLVHGEAHPADVRTEVGQ